METLPFVKEFSENKQKRDTGKTTNLLILIKNSSVSFVKFCSHSLHDLEYPKQHQKLLIKKKNT